MAPPLISTFAAGTRGYGQGAGGSAFVLPTGIIIPYTGSTAPTDWTDFSSADDKSLVGAGSTYAAGATGGSTSLSEAIAYSTTGGHNGNYINFSAWNGNYYHRYTENTFGDHTHNASATANGLYPPYKKFKLIKATADVNAVPSGGIILGVDSISGDVSIAENGIDSSLMGGTYGSTGGANSHSVTVDISTTSGSHGHNNGRFSYQSSETNYSNGQGFTNANQGGHTHNATGSVDMTALKRIYCSAWSNASNDFEFEGQGIAMWESATPPEGWFICDGTNSTPDMRDYFVFIGGTDNHGTTSGSGAPNWSVSTDAFNSSHSHNLQNFIQYQTQISGKTAQQ